MPIKNEFLVYDGLRDCRGSVRGAIILLERGETKGAKDLLEDTARTLDSMLEVGFGMKPRIEDITKLDICGMALDQLAEDQYRA